MTTTALTGRLALGGQGRLQHVAERLSRGVLATALAAGLVAPGALADVGPALLVVAGLLGLPHGAVDHLAWGW